MGLRSGGINGEAERQARVTGVVDGSSRVPCCRSGPTAGRLTSHALGGELHLLTHKHC